MYNGELKVYKQMKQFLNIKSNKYNFMKNIRKSLGVVHRKTLT